MNNIECLGSQLSTTAVLNLPKYQHKTHWEKWTSAVARSRYICFCFTFTSPKMSVFTGCLWDLAKICISDVHHIGVLWLIGYRSLSADNHIGMFDRRSLKRQILKKLDLADGRCIMMLMRVPWEDWQNMQQHRLSLCLPRVK